MSHPLSLDLSIELLPVERAQQIILDAVQPLSSETVSLDASLGRVIARDAAADTDIPPFDNSAMDGYAVRSRDASAASPSSPVTLRIVADERAGQVFTGRVGKAQAVRIMTGAPAPHGADAVVPVEDTRLVDEGRVQILAAARPHENIRKAGGDVQRGDIVVSAGSVIGPAEMGMLASTGHPAPEVFRRPRVAIVTTGDELVYITQAPGPGQIRNSNLYSILGQTRSTGAEVSQTLHVLDNRTGLIAALQSAAACSDAVVTCGGVSVGEYDLVKQALAEMGEISFWRVAVKPGKPFAFGQIGGAALFGLPGNPVSSMVTFDLFVRPALRKMAGHARPLPVMAQAAATAPINHKPGRAEYVRAHACWSAEGLRATPSAKHGSHQLSSMVGANCYIVLAPDQADINAGETVQIMLMSGS